MSDNDISAKGIIVPTKVQSFEEEPCDMIDKLVVFQPKTVLYKGIIKWYGKINNFKAYGIETDPIEFGTNGEFNKKQIFSCKNECGILIKETNKILEIDEEFECIKKKHWKDFKINMKDEMIYNDFYVVKMGNSLKVEQNVSKGTINEIECYHLEIVESGEEFYFIAKNILGNFADFNGRVYANYDGIYQIRNCPEVFPVDIEGNIYFKCGNNYQKGILKWKGKIDNLKCIGILADYGKLHSDFRKHFNGEDIEFGTVICLDIAEKENSILYEISDPVNYKIFTYFKLNTYIKLLNKKEDIDGSVRAYFTDGKQFFYQIKETNNNNSNLIIAENDNVKCGFIQIQNGFEEVKDPKEYGIISHFKLNDYVQVNPDKQNGLDSICYGQIVWMGFDRDSSFKYLLNLDEANKNGNNGELFGYKLTKVKHNHGLLVNPNCLIPFGYQKSENPINKMSEIVTEYQRPRSTVTYDYERGIQGDKNSCYMDTSFFAMFTFQELFDNLLMEKEDDTSKIREILRSRIIYPLRKNEYVSFERVSEFRQELENRFPQKKFLHSEKDPEELLETLFHLLTPTDPLLRTFHIATKTKQNCFMTQLFYVNEKSSPKTIKISEMLDRTFLQGGILINKPPKSLILQLPRHGTQYKQYSEVDIEPKINITHLIRYAKHSCSFCSNDFDKICLECSKDKFVYLCSNDLQKCKHEKYSCAPKACFKGKIELELFAILCIEKTHYVAYVKTGEVLEKWVYYDSMAASDQNILKPIIRQTTIGKYFKDKVEDDSNIDDLYRIKNHAFVCFYKNPTLQYYCKDFNHVENIL